MVSNSPPNSWIRCLRASRDIHEQNIEAIRSRDDGVFIRVTREVSVGELLCGWYDESYAREIGVPHLTLQNIKGVYIYNDKSSHVTRNSKLRGFKYGCSCSPYGRIYVN